MMIRNHWSPPAAARALFAAALVAAALSASAASARPATVSDAFGPAPPPPHVENVTPAPGALDAYAWIPGRWQWDGERYDWVHGAWQRRAYRGAVWGPGFWEHHNDRWRWHDGHWLQP